MINARLVCRRRPRERERERICVDGDRKVVERTRRNHAAGSLTVGGNDTLMSYRIHQLPIALWNIELCCIQDRLITQEIDDSEHLLSKKYLRITS